MQETFFANSVYTDIETEGIKYTGSKLKIIPRIISTIAGLECKTVLDAFSGSTRVTQAFAQCGFDTTSNDISEWSQVFSTNYLLSTQEDSFYQEIIDHLNALEGFEGWYTENYGGTNRDLERGIKRPFQRHNTLKLDAIRSEIDRLNLKWADKCVILTSLIYALDAVDNTLGHYASYLSSWSSRSYNTMKLKLPNRFWHTKGCKVSKTDAFDAIKEYHDLMYFDPPYGSNNEKMPPSRVRYSAYYHLWKTIVLNDMPVLFGKANRRVDSKDTVNPSIFEEYKKDDNGKFIALKGLEKLIKEANAHYILLSYSSGGRATKEELFEIIRANGRLIEANEFDYKKNVMARMVWTNQWTRTEDSNKEYLFLIEK